MIAHTQVAIRVAVSAILFACCVAQYSRPLIAQGAGPTLAYSFSEGAGTTTADVSGNAVTGTLLNGTGWTTQGKYGSAVVLDGSDDEVEVPASAPVDLTTAFTIEAWIYPTSALPYGTIFSRLLGPGGHAYAFMVCCGSRLLARGSTEAGVTSVYGDTTIRPNEWTHVATTWDGTTLRTYVNGISDNSATLSGTLLPSAEPVRIGGGPGTNFTGRIDEIRVYGRALSGSEIGLDMYAPVDQTAPPAVAYKQPIDGVTGVAVTSAVTVTFTKPMAAGTITTSTVVLERADAQGIINAAVAYDASTRAATLTPALPLDPLTAYRARVVGGASGVRGADNDEMTGDVT